MIESERDLAQRKRDYAKAGFVYKGRQPVPGVPGAFKHVWEKPAEKRTSRRRSR